MGGRGEKGTARALVDRVPCQGGREAANLLSQSTAWTGRKPRGNLTPTGRTIRQEKPLASDAPTVPQTDTGGPVEDTEARERTLVKELGKLTP